MRDQCEKCGSVNFGDAARCPRCARLDASSLKDRPSRSIARSIGRRAVICVEVCVLMLLLFYVSLVASSRGLSVEQENQLRNAIVVLRDRGFTADANRLETFAKFRGSDNWLNSISAKENAFAATNFPFAIITLYSDFFAYPKDDIERAAILLHESRHLSGEDENQAYKYVWLNRHRLGWSRASYHDSPVWENVRLQTIEVAPELFQCPDRELGDCTEIPFKSLPR
jgi:hypothetical protein